MFQYSVRDRCPIFARNEKFFASNVLWYARICTQTVNNIKYLLSNFQPFVVVCHLVSPRVLHIILKGYSLDSLL